MKSNSCVFALILLLIIVLQVKFYYSNILSFFEVPLHCVTTNRLCNIIEFRTFSANLGCLWQCCESSITHYERWCFEPKVWALAPWGCTPFYDIHVLGTLWKAYLPKDSWQPWTKKETIFLKFWVGGLHFLYEMQSVKGPFIVHFLFACNR